MRKTAFLIFDSVHICLRCSKDALFHDIFQKALALEEENTCDNVWSITCRLAGQKGVSNFNPILISNESYKHIRTWINNVEGAQTPPSERMVWDKHFELI